MKTVGSNSRKRWLFLAAIFAVLVWVPIRVSDAKTYMHQQMTRLEGEGFPGYEIFRCDWLSVSDYADYPCITVQARRKEDDSNAGGDGYRLHRDRFPVVSIHGARAQDIGTPNQGHPNGWSFPVAGARLRV
jgi:hypothetical protein